MMPETRLSEDDRSFLLAVARKAIEDGISGKPLPTIDHGSLSSDLLKIESSFVTLTLNDRLRGCIGALEAYQPLVDDVQEHALAAALDDYRFSPVNQNEIKHIHIEISRLTPSVHLDYEDPLDLPGLLVPNVDGVILRDGRSRATFLPQVWGQVPDPSKFLDQLCLKMGASPNLWKSKVLDISIYHVEEWSETEK